MTHRPLDRDPLDRFARYLGQYAPTPPAPPTEGAPPLTGVDAEVEGLDDDFVIPEDLVGLPDEDLTALHEQAVANFDALFGDGSGLTDADLAALAALTDGIETLLIEVDRRAAAAAERETTAAELAGRAHPENAAPAPDAPVVEPVPVEGVVPVVTTLPAPAVPAPAPVEIAAGGRPRGEIRVNLAGLPRNRVNAPTMRTPAEARTMRDVVLASGEGSGFAAGTGLDWTDVGAIVDRRLASFNQSQYEAAARSGQHMRQQFGVATIMKPFEPDLVISSNDPSHIDTVLQRAVNESRLPGGSLVAAGGWCAPSQVIYDLCELESRDGLVSLPEVAVLRGGITWTPGPLFSDIYANTSFTYTETDDIAGKYGPGQPATVGNKPCYRVTCPPFQTARLSLTGLCITAGLLQQRGYPEVIARTTRGALVAHDHKVSAGVINALVAGSTAITMTAGQVGATSPLLTAIELQVEHYRYTQRLARSTTLEAIFPYWVRGVIRSDISLRQNGDLELMSITDRQINDWFTSRGINPQFVYDWQTIDGTAANAFKTWPAAVTFLLYAAGVWVKGTSDVITLDTIYDSVLLGQNDFTALFSEEGWLVAKLCQDSRVITVALNPNGGTGAGQVLDPDGTILGVG